MPGPAPKPTRLKELAGNPGKRPLNRREPRPPAPAEAPYAPRFLCVEGKREWHRMVRLLLQTGLYAEVDQAALAMYCQAWGRWVEMERRLATAELILETDKGYVYVHPLLGVANTAWEQLRKMLSRFGLSPADRARLVVPEPEEQDELAELLFRRGVRVTDE